MSYSELNSSHSTRQLACKEFPMPVFSPKQISISEFQFLKMPPQDDKLPDVEPSVLHFVQFKGGGCHISSIILGALGG